MLTRRDFCYGLGATLGTVAFNAMLRAESATSQASTGPLAPKRRIMRKKAKACIFLFMEGGPSHIDTFDPKPKLADFHMKEFRREGEKFESAMSSGKRYFVQSPYKFRQVGKSGMWMCDQFQHLENVADDLCVYRGCQAESIDHPTACYHMNTGNRFGGDPAIGAWTTYGLGTLNQNLPAFVVLPEGAFPQGGAANWSNGFLPAHTGTPLRPTGSPILDLKPPAGVTAEIQRANLDLLAELNRSDMRNHPHQADLSARMEAYELAFRMQAQVPGIVDLSREDKKTLEMYGIGKPETDSFGRRCLLARKLVQNGVRFVQLFEGGWDSHDYIQRSHAARIRSVDQPMSALIADLKRLGLLDSTLVIWSGEFGRSPDNGVRSGENVAGRDHNAKAMTMLLAGGGTRAGSVVGATDDLGAKAVDVVHPIKDLHVTLLHLLGLNDNKLTYFHEGRYKQLSQFGGDVIRELIA